MAYPYNQKEVWHSIAKPLSCLSLSLFLRFAFQFIAEDDAHNHTDEADDEASKHGGPKAIDGEPDADGLPDFAGEQKHDRVDDDAEKAEGENDQRTGEEFQQWPHQCI